MATATKNPVRKAPKQQTHDQPQWPGEIWSAHEWHIGRHEHVGFLVTARGDIDKPIAFVRTYRLESSTPDSDAERHSQALAIAVDLAKHPSHAKDRKYGDGIHVVTGETAAVILYEEHTLLIRLGDAPDGNWYGSVPFEPERFGRMLKQLVGAADKDVVTITIPRKVTWLVSDLRGDKPTYFKEP